ncbi:hypothetical protein WA026_010722 [Henosepilachna vigintioctopunctata]|uniref:Uncharacterized protein n=1 Tax=Henosepilachna vigintioctopunctata TaxID=420089 RepID=A0AAW1UWE3_9CUCU
MSGRCSSNICSKKSTLLRDRKSPLDCEFRSRQDRDRYRCRVRKTRELFAFAQTHSHIQQNVQIKGNCTKFHGLRFFDFTSRRSHKIEQCDNSTCDTMIAQH